MPQPHRLSSARLRLESLEERVVPAAVVWRPESFDASPLGTLPAGWATRNNPGTLTVAEGRSVSGARSLVARPVPGGEAPALAWGTTVFPENFGVQARVLTEGDAAVRLLARGESLATDRPAYVAVSVSAGGVELIRVRDGQQVSLGGTRLATPLAGVWLQATLLCNGDQLQVELYRPDTGEYLDSAGRWVRSPSLTLAARDASPPRGGVIGVARAGGTAGSAWVDNLGVITPTPDSTGNSVFVEPARPRPLTSPVREGFEGTPVGGLPAGWQDWTTTPDRGRFAVAAYRGSEGRGLASAGQSDTAARAWLRDPAPGDAQVSASIYVDSLIPAELIVRGSSLDGTAPTYYAATVTRNMTVQITRTVAGRSAVLATQSTAGYFADRWVQFALSAQGTQLQLTARRLDTGEYLNAAGQWQATATSVLTVRDALIPGGPGGGQVGLGRQAAYAGTLVFDDFQSIPLLGDTQPPQLSVATPPGVLSGVARVKATATDNVAVARVEFLLDGAVQQTRTDAPYAWDWDTRFSANGTHLLTVRATDAAGNRTQTVRYLTVANDAIAPPAIPRKYPHIRIAQLAYQGNPLGAFEQQLLRESVDLVIPATGLIPRIAQVAPATPQLIYTNASNIYQDLLTDWLQYADRRGVSREAAFYHVAKPTAWVGGSPSAQPVNWFWNVLRGNTYLTELVRGGSAGGFNLGGMGESVQLGYPERFGELNVDVRTPAGSFYRSRIEYVSAVDAQGRPTAWSTLPLLADATGGFRASGRIRFDPPADWKAAVLNGSGDRLFYLRIRNTGFTGGPVLNSILGRDYASAAGGSSGVIPVFDSRADRDGDGYLNDAEYARRAPGMEARFAYESRWFYPYYGQMRYATNPASPAFRDWLVDYHQRLLARNPLAAGLFVDNSGGILPLEGAQLLESTATYTSDFASAMGRLQRGIGPKFLVGNTSGGGAETVEVLRQIPGSMEEFALRPLSTNWTRFEDVAELVRTRQAANPAAMLILDSLPTNGSPTDPRTQLATLAYYYLLGNPDTTYLMFNGGFAPASPWVEHWSAAAAVNVGRPQGAFTTLAAGDDPADPTLSYKVMQRNYGNGLVLYKPLSFSPRSQRTGTLADATATTHALPGRFRAVRADGTLGPVVTSVTLRNGEGAVLVRA